MSRRDGNDDGTRTDARTLTTISAPASPPRSPSTTSCSCRGTRTVLPTQVDVTHAPHPQHPPQRAARQRGDGHRHRVAAGDRDGAARRPRRHPQEPVDRGAGVRSRSREAVGERHDRRSDHALPDQPDLRSARADEEVPDLRRADHRGRQQGRAAGRHPHQPRPALRDQRRPADRRRDDARAAVHRAGRHDARRRRARSCTSHKVEKLLVVDTRLPAEGADHRQGHPEGGQVSERVQGLARPAALRRGDRRRAATRWSAPRRWSPRTSTCWSSTPRTATRRACSTWCARMRRRVPRRRSRRRQRRDRRSAPRR